MENTKFVANFIIFLMNFNDLQSFLDEKVEQYNTPDFIENDPIQIPHQFDLKQDIEISSFLATTIAWGNRKSIIQSANKMIDLMGNSPYDFVMEFSVKNLEKIENKAIHRTFSMEDFLVFLHCLQKIYQEYDSLESLFLLKEGETNFYHSLQRFRTRFFQEYPTHRSNKHISSTYKNSAAKRLVMFLRWLVRKDKKGVDFGIWQDISAEFLSVPLDVHSGNIARKLGLITRKQNDWKTVEELDIILRKMDKKDPAKYDFALFGLGVTKEL